MCQLRGCKAFTNNPVEGQFCVLKYELNWMSWVILLLATVRLDRIVIGDVFPSISGCMGE